MRFVFDRAPVRVYWEVTRACDLACRHCRAEAVKLRHRDELTPIEGLRLLEQLAAFGDPKPHLVLTGGDPLKRPDIWTLIAVARQLGLSVSLAPSATPLLGMPEIARLKAAGVEAISLSIDGSSAAKHDAFRGVDGTFDRTTAAAQSAAALDLSFQINTLVAAETLSDLPAIGALAARLGASRWSLFFLVSVGRGTMLTPITSHDAEGLMDWLLSPGIRVATSPPPRGLVVTTTEAPHIRRVQRQQRGPAVRGGGPGAGIRDGNGILFISHTGDVNPSGFLPICVGNIRTDDVVTLYREDPLFQSLRRPDLFAGRCGRCEFHWVCGGSRARAYASSGDPLGEDPLCLYEPRRVTFHEP
jgi:radical SAM protein with 4Fe4S-binding SPASM domain